FVTSARVFASSVFPTPAGPSMSTGRPMRSARNTTVEMRRLAMYRAFLKRCWTSSTDWNMAAPSIFGSELAFSLAHPSTGLAGGGDGVTLICVRWIADTERARTYHRWQFLLGGAGFAVSLLYLIAWLASGAALALRNALEALTPAWGVTLALALFVIGAGHVLVSLPLSWLGGFWLPRRFGLLHQPLPRWLWDRAKAGLVGALLGLVA